MTARDAIRAQPGDFLPGRTPSLDGPARNGRDWTGGLPAGLYAPGRSDPRYWPRGIRQVTARVTPADLAGHRAAHPVAAAVTRVLRLPEAARVRVYDDWFTIRLGETTEWHDLPRPASQIRGDLGEFTFCTAENWQAPGAAEEEGSWKMTAST